ncbi:MAG: hypothetical protein ACXAC7_19260, partial [Candidatus Hodarchaeales archaeon]
TSSLNGSNLFEHNHKNFEFNEVGKYILNLSFALEIFISIEEYSDTIVEGTYSIINVEATNYYRDHGVKKGRPRAFYITQIILFILIIVVFGFIYFQILKIVKRVKTQIYYFYKIKNKRNSYTMYPKY